MYCGVQLRPQQRREAAPVSSSCTALRPLSRIQSAPTEGVERLFSFYVSIVANIFLKCVIYSKYK